MVVFLHLAERCYRTVYFSLVELRLGSLKGNDIKYHALNHSTKIYCVSFVAGTNLLIIIVCSKFSKVSIISCIVNSIAVKIYQCIIATVKIFYVVNQIFIIII